MANRYQNQNRAEIRQSIGINTGICIVGTTNSEVPDTSSLIDSLNLIGPADEFNGDEVLIYDTTDDAVPEGESSNVADFDGSGDATLSPVLTAAINTGDKYELWRAPWRIADINNVINQMIDGASGRIYPVKETHTAFTESEKYLYNVLSGFTHLSRVEYAYTTGTLKTIHKCLSAWDESTGTGVTASLDSNFFDGGSLKLVMTSAATTEILATDDITEVDISGCTEVQVWIYSTVALAAGDLQLLLDDTASCASPVESLDIPATTANTKTRHIITLANPQSDSAIISVGIKQIVDKGAFNLWAKNIIAQDDETNDYRILPGEYWNVVKGSTPYLQLTYNGLSVVGSSKQLRLTGNKLITQFSGDSTDADIDPSYLIAAATARLLIGHAKSARLDIQDKAGLAAYWQAMADRKMVGMTPNWTGDTKAVS